MLRYFSYIDTNVRNITTDDYSHRSIFFMHVNGGILQSRMHIVEGGNLNVNGRAG